MGGMMLISENLSIQSNSERIKDEFDNKIGRLTKSKAYLDFCEEVYGYRTYLFNMMDREQLDFVFYSIPLTSDDTLLDLGCGSGSILNLLVEKYGCSGIGIDQLNSIDIMGKNNKSVAYIKGDIDRLLDYRLKPTVTLSVDSLYFSNDLDTLFRTLYGFQNCRTYIFYSQYLFEETTGDRSTLRGDNTRIAELLNKNGFSYEAIDFSKNEQLMYEESLAVLKKHKEDFLNEGNSDLYESKLKETMIGKRLYDKGLASRFLYITK
jgi:SAM-dependent methyltransferase